MFATKNTKIFCFFILSLLPGLFFGSSNANADGANETVEYVETALEKNKVICVTIPKAGTHLLIKCLTLLNIEGISYDYNKPPKSLIGKRRVPYKNVTLEEYCERKLSSIKDRLNDKQENRTSFLVHLPFTPMHKQYLEQHSVANFLMIRDPRDQIISLAATSLKNRSDRQDGLKETLLDLLNHTRTYTPWGNRHGACDVVWNIGIVNFYRAYLEWAKEPNFCVVRFENLIGPNGGGTLEAQFAEIKKIGAHLGVQLSDEEIVEVSNQLFGGTRTFKNGQTKAWEEYYSPEVKSAFKAVPGACQLLIDLGYEKDCDW